MGLSLLFYLRSGDYSFCGHCRSSHCFVFLVAPAIMAVTLTDHIGKQLAIGWTLGIIVTLMGLVASYLWDLPTGPSIIGCYAFILLLMGAGFILFKK